MMNIINYTPDMGTPTSPGIYNNMSYDVYHQIPAIRSSYLKALDTCPASAGVPLKDTKVLKLGRVGHTLILESDEVFKSQYALIPDTDIFKMNKNSNEYKKAYADFQNSNIGKTIIPVSSSKDPDQSDLEMLRAIKHNLMIHPTASRIISERPVEQSILWVDKETQELCKIRTDIAPYEHLKAIGDLKLIENVGEYEFGQAVRKYGYFISAGMYLEGASIAYGEHFDVAFFICGEKDEPYRVAVHELDQDYIEHGINEFHRLLRVHKQRKEDTNPITGAKGWFPPWTHSGICVIRFPQYLRGDSA
jgi:hypothetical protein